MIWSEAKIFNFEASKVIHFSSSSQKNFIETFFIKSEIKNFTTAIFQNLYLQRITFKYLRVTPIELHLM